MSRWASMQVEAGPVHPASGSGRLARVGLNWIAALATGAALVLGTVLTLVFAATLAVVTVLAGALFALYALALRARRGGRATGGAVLLEARRVGHSWVAYGWDQRTR